MVTLGGKRSDGAKSDNGGSSSAATPTTRVIAACTLLVGHPNPATPNHGDVDVTLTASPLSGPRFDIMGRENGEIATGNYGVLNNESQQQQQLPGNLSNIISNTAQNNEAINTTPSPTDIKEIESWVRRVLRSSRYVNPAELGIETGISAWRVRISLHIVNHEGNVCDATLLAACAALADLKLPMVEIDRGVVKIVTSKETESQGNTSGSRNCKAQRKSGRSLTLGPLPVPLTIALLSNKNNKSEGHDSSQQQNQSILLVDPTHLEEDAAAGNTVTMVCNTNEEVVEFHKKGSGCRLSTEQVMAIGCMGFGRARELEKLIKTMREV